MGAACPQGHRTRSWWERRGSGESQRPREPSLPQRKTLTGTPCDVCPGISHRRSDMVHTRFLERETQLSWGPPETDAPRRRVRGHDGTRGRELPTPVWGTRWNPTASTEPSGGRSGNSRLSRNCWESPWGGGRSSLQPPAHRAEKPRGWASPVQGQHASCSSSGQGGPERRWGEAVVLEMLLGLCFPQLFVTKDILFQIPTPHLRSSSLSVKRRSHSFHPCCPGWRCVGRVGLA